MRDIGAYFATQKAGRRRGRRNRHRRGPERGHEVLPGRREAVPRRQCRAGIPACLACHGPAGRGNPGPSYPSLGGQHAGYTAARLKFFRAGGVWGKETNANTIMAEVAE